MDASKFKEIRAELCFTQKELARRLDVSIDAIKSWETGRRKIPGPVKILLYFLQDGGQTRDYLER